MRLIKKIAICLLILFVVIQFIRPPRNDSSSQVSTDISRIYNVPVTIDSILEKACTDCHSNHTRYPWYTNIQPAGWLLNRHIRQGKNELNFSEFGSYSKRRQVSKLSGIASSIKDGTMPLDSYKWLHKDARLSRQEKELIINWATRTKDSLELNN